MVRFDEDQRELLSNEHGEAVKVWNHHIKVEPLSERRTLYTD
jgi:hypothetical protein